MRDRRILFVGIVVFLLAVGVVIVFTGGRGTEAEPEVGVVPQESESDESEMEIISTNAEVVPATAEIEETQVVAPAIKTELTATDPSTVNLVSGRVQLVEAFAFW